MELDFYYNQHNQASVVSTTATPVDARVLGEAMQLCEFAGHEHSPDEKRKCKFYCKSQYRDCCIWYYEEINVKGDLCHCGKAGER